MANPVNVSLNIPLSDEFQGGIEVVVLNGVTKGIEMALERQSKAKDFMNLKEACEYIGVSFATLSNYRKMGLRVSVIQGRSIISKQEIIRFLESYEQ